MTQVLSLWRSGRRGSNTVAVNQNLDEVAINFNNRWRKTERAKGGRAWAKHASFLHPDRTCIARASEIWTNIVIGGNRGIIRLQGQATEVPIWNTKSIPCILRLCSEIT